MPSRLGGNDVFINCPLDEAYKPTFHAILFAVYYLGFAARCAREVDDASELRLDKIMRIIGLCAYGVHGISSVGLTTGTNLPRFNMPLGLGLFLGCKRFGGRMQRKKACLILDTDQYRYRAFISDISGQDIHSHKGKPQRAIAAVRNWLANASRTKGLPGGADIAAGRARFIKNLPRICKKLKRRPKDLTFADFSEMVEIWLKAAR